MEDVDRHGITPLMAACIAGRADNVRYIIDTLKDKKAKINDSEDEDEEADENVINADSKMGVAGIYEKINLRFCPDCKYIF